MILRRGEPAPDFELRLLQRSGSETEASLDPSAAGEIEAPQYWQLRDALSLGPVLLVFVKESCPTCEFALPLIDRIYRNYPDSKVSMVTVAQEDAKGAAKIVQEWRIQMPVVLDEDPYAVGEEYGVCYVPTFFYIHSGRVIEQVVESFAREEIQALNARIAQFNGVAPIPFYGADEDVPLFRPG